MGQSGAAPTDSKKASLDTVTWSTQNTASCVVNNPVREKPMPYIIAEPCIDVKDRGCVDVCPVDCIYEGPDHLYIHPEECIDCGACEPECPVTAIFTEEETPEEFNSYIKKNADYFENGEDREVASGRGS